MIKGKRKSFKDALRGVRFVLSHRADIILALRLVTKIVFVRIHLKLFDYDATSRFVAKRAKNTVSKISVDDSDLQFAKHVGFISNGLARHVPFEAKCLVRSLVVWWELKQRGLPAHLKLGVATTDGFAAHAWVELSRCPVTDTLDAISDFATFERSIR